MLKYQFSFSVKKEVLSVAAAIAAAFAPAVNAQEGIPTPIKGWYATAGVGGSWALSPSFSSSGSGVAQGFAWTSSTTGTAGAGGGVAVEAGAGYDFGNNIRAELTYIYNNHAATRGSFSGTATSAGFNIPYNGSYSPNGSISTNSIFASGYYDIPTKSRFRPYVGAGLGWTSVSSPRIPLTFTGTVGGVNFTGDATSDSGSASAFGYQAKVGVSYLANKATDVFLEGTYQGNTSVTISGVSIGGLNDFGVRAGLRYRFGKNN